MGLPIIRILFWGGVQAVILLAFFKIFIGSGFRDFGKFGCALGLLEGCITVQEFW